MNTHRAIVRHTGTVEVEMVPTPDPAAGEMVIATQVAGLCGTDIQMLRGLRDDRAPIIGHEGIGRVIAVGDGVPPYLRPGTLVTVNPTHSTDPALLLGHTFDGLLQERTLLPAAVVAGGMVLDLPADIDLDLGPLLEPLAVVRYAMSLLRSFRPVTLLIVGDGTIGHLAARAAGSWLGESTRVVLAHHTEDGLRFSAAARHPASVALTVGTPAAAGLPGPVAVLLATPRDATLAMLEQVLTTVGDDAVIDIVGGLPPGASARALPDVDLAAVRAANCAGQPEPAVVHTTAGGLRLFGHRGVGNTHLRAAARELARRPEAYRDLITHRTDLDGAARIMRSLRAGPSRLFDGRRLVKLAIKINTGKESS